MSTNQDKSKSEYYRVVVQPRENFLIFRTQDVGKHGGIQRVAGLSFQGMWDTQAWLIHKDMAHVENNRLVADHNNTRKLFKSLPTAPTHIEGNLFSAQ